MPIAIEAIDGSPFGALAPPGDRIALAQRAAAGAGRGASRVWRRPQLRQSHQGSRREDAEYPAAVHEAGLRRRRSRRTGHLSARRAGRALRVRAGRGHRQRARRVSAADAPGIVFGYTCANDISERVIQREEMGMGSLVVGKGYDTFCPLGPVIVTDIDPSTPAHPDPRQRRGPPGHNTSDLSVRCAD